MSWRFRKTFRVIPGVKLNLTRYGLSATIGAVTLSLNLGPRGTYVNMDIPGTGIYNRVRVDSPSALPQEHTLEPTTAPGNPPPDPRLSPASSRYFGVSAVTEVRSASTELLGSESMEGLRRLLSDAYSERDALAKEISTAANETNIAVSRYRRWEHGVLMKRIRKQAFAARKEASETAVAKLEELQEQLRLTTLATEITIDREQADPYYRMRDDFAALSECGKIWDTLERRAINRFVERSAAHEAITRDPVTFSLNECDLIKWEKKVYTSPHISDQAIS